MYVMYLFTVYILIHQHCIVTAVFVWAKLTMEMLG